MGLDMYLDKRFYVSEFSENKDVIDQILSLIGAKDESNNYKHLEITVPAVYWRKANAIHKWFVDNVQDGTDNCGSYYVDTDTLKELLELCKKQLAEKGKPSPEVFLPPQEGFFFGSTDLDEWYWDDIERSVEELAREIKFVEGNKGWSFEYRSSW